MIPYDLVLVRQAASILEEVGLRLFNQRDFDGSVELVTAGKQLRKFCHQHEEHQQENAALLAAIKAKEGK